MLQAPQHLESVELIPNVQAKQHYHRELGMLIKEAEFERSELIVEMAKVYEVVVDMKVSLVALTLLRVMQKWMMRYLSALTLMRAV